MRECGNAKRQRAADAYAVTGSGRVRSVIRCYRECGERWWRVKAEDMLSLMRILHRRPGAWLVPGGNRPGLANDVTCLDQHTERHVWLAAHKRSQEFKLGMERPIPPAAARETA